MFNLLNSLVCAALFSTSPVSDPASPKALSFDASAYVTVKNEIRVSVEKTAEEPVTVLLRNRRNELLFREVIGRKDLKYALKMKVADLADGQYELEIRSSRGSIRKEISLVTPKETNRQIVMLPTSLQ
ncbi:hypothetical protein [Larkinella soli]|uniref:hypothetical protein n=1 Tax=Larkinella soli TaxID=1770527 RepID=UPI000FFC96FF|nr:hypothetical protein [Larkinella soli]